MSEKEPQFNKEPEFKPAYNFSNLEKDLNKAIEEGERMAKEDKERFEEEKKKLASEYGQETVELLFEIPDREKLTQKISEKDPHILATIDRNLERIFKTSRQDEILYYLDKKSTFEYLDDWYKLDKVREIKSIINTNIEQKNEEEKSKFQNEKNKLTFEDGEKDLERIELIEENFCHLLEKRYNKNELKSLDTLIGELNDSIGSILEGRKPRNRAKILMKSDEGSHYDPISKRVIINPEQIKEFNNNYFKALKLAIRHERSHELFNKLTKKQQEEVAKETPDGELIDFYRKIAKERWGEKYLDFNRMINNRDEHLAKFELDIKLGNQLNLDNFYEIINYQIKGYHYPMIIDNRIIDRSRLVDEYLAWKRENWKPGEEHWKEEFGIKEK